MSLTLQQLAKQLGFRFSGDPDLTISGVASLTSARSSDLCFLHNSKNLQVVANSNCAAIIVPEKSQFGTVGKAFIYSPNPQLSFVKAIELLSSECINPQSGEIHPTAQVHETAILGKAVSIGALSVVGERVEIGSESRVGAGCIIDDDARLGNRCLLHSRVTVGNRVELGDGCIMHSGVVLGSDGFGLIESNQRWIKVPQIGAVIIGDEVEIGANSTVDRGALDDTVIENGCKLDNLIQVAHNVRIGANTAIAACVGIAGSAVIGRNCKIGGAAVVLGHLSIADNVMITAMSLVTKDIRKSGIYSSGTPLMQNSEWHKVNVRYKSLDKLARTIKRLDK